MEVWKRKRGRDAGIHRAADWVYNPPGGGAAPESIPHHTVAARGFFLALFLEEALANYPTVASVAPSSRHLARAMAEPLRKMKAGVVVELGAGTGVITRALLELLPDDVTLIAFEINKKFYRYLRRNFNDPRLLLVNASAETVGQKLAQLGLARADAGKSAEHDSGQLAGVHGQQDRVSSIPLPAGADRECLPTTAQERPAERAPAAAPTFRLGRVPHRLAQPASRAGLRLQTQTRPRPPRVTSFPAG